MGYPWHWMLDELFSHFYKIPASVRQTEKHWDTGHTTLFKCTV